MAWKPSRQQMQDDEDKFLDILYRDFKEIYEALYAPGIFGDVLIDDLARSFPSIYKKILNRMDDE